MSESIKRRILFVDDEQDVLDGLRRMLRGMRREWEINFALSGKKALEILSTTPVDVVVSDMRMPGMDGAQLLSEVLKRHPNVVRIVLSGHSEREMVMKSVGPAHQYLAKPCDAETLKSVVGRACALRDLLAEGALKKVVSQLESLPSFPELYFELIEELKSPESSMDRVGKIISKDMAMTAKILQLVNSAFFGIPQHVSNPAHAAKLIGLDIIRALVLSMRVFSHFEKIPMIGLQISELWDHSAVSAVCAKEIAIAETQDKKVVDDAFISGMLHDIGILILSANFPGKYKEAIELTNKGNIPFFEAEIQVFGASHAEVGGYLLALWGLPNVIAEAVFFHHKPEKCHFNQFTPLTAVHVASALEAKNRRLETMKSLTEISDGYLKTIGMADRLPKWIETCEQVFARGESDG